MKLMLIIGGLMGFGIGVSFGLVHDKSLPSAIVHACIAAYVGGMLMRWWGRVWLRELRRSLEEESRG